MRAVALCLVLLLVTLPAAAEDRAALVAKLTGEDNTARLAAYRALLRDKSPAVVPLLLEALPDSPDIAQYYGVNILQQQPDKEKRKALKALLRAKSPHLRVLAAAALHRLGERGAALVVVKALKTPGVDDATRAMMLMRIYSLRDPAIQEAVREFLEPDEASAVIEAAVYDVYLVRDKAAQAALVGLCAHEKPDVRVLAAGCLLVLGDAGQVDALVAALEDPELSTSPLYKLKTFLSQARPAPPAVLAALHARMADETNAYALRTLVEILGEHGYAKAVREIRGFLDHENAQLSKAAFGALARFPGAITTETMRELLEGGSDARRLAAADALRRSDDTSGLPVVIDVLKNAEKDQDRWEAALSLGRYRDPKAVDALLDALLDEHATVRSNAYNSLGGVLRVMFPYRRFDLARTGYVYSASAAARKAATARLRAWWDAHRKADW